MHCKSKWSYLNFCSRKGTANANSSRNPSESDKHLIELIQKSYARHHRKRIAMATAPTPLKKSLTTTRSHRMLCGRRNCIQPRYKKASPTRREAYHEIPLVQSFCEVRQRPTFPRGPRKGIKAYRCARENNEIVIDVPSEN